MVSDLYVDDENYQRQCEDADKEFEKKQKLLGIYRLLKVKVNKGCYMCRHNLDGMCHVMDSFGQEPFEVTIHTKCSAFSEKIVEVKK